MGVYSNYQYKGTMPVLLSYRCSKCGREITSLQIISLRQSYKGSTPVGRAARERQRQSAERQFKEYMRESSSKFADEVNSRRFRNRFASPHACEQCGNIEPWYCIRNPSEILFLNYAIPVLVVLLILLLLTDVPVLISWIGLALLALLGVRALLYERKLRPYKEALKTLPEESFPRATPATDS